MNDLVASSFRCPPNSARRVSAGGGAGGERRRYRRAESEHQMGLHGDGVRHDRGGDTQFRGGAAAGADLRHHAEMAAGGWNGGAPKFIILPMVALSLAYIASIARITRGSMIEVLHSNFIRTARAKGLPMRRIIFRHALKPALLPVLSYMGPAFVGIITGSMVIETIYGLPGIGQLFVNGALNRDYSRC